jgi:hypothetical protein
MGELVASISQELVQPIAVAAVRARGSLTAGPNRMISGGLFDTIEIERLVDRLLALVGICNSFCPRVIANISLL